MYNVNKQPDCTKFSCRKTTQNYTKMERLTSKGIGLSILYLVGCGLQGQRADPGVDLTILLEERGEAAPWSPLQNEAQRLQDHPNEVDDVGVLQTMED